MNADRNSDESIVPAKLVNNDVTETSAEPVEERDSTKRNAEQAGLPRTPSRTKRKSRGLHGVREAARKDSQLKFTALLHHIDCEMLQEAIFDLKKSVTSNYRGRFARELPKLKLPRIRMRANAALQRTPFSRVGRTH